MKLFVLVLDLEKLNLPTSNSFIQAVLWSFLFLLREAGLAAVYDFMHAVLHSFFLYHKKTVCATAHGMSHTSSASKLFVLSFERFSLPQSLVSVQLSFLLDRLKSSFN